MKLSAIRSCSLFLFRLLGSYLVFCLVLWFAQDVLLFPLLSNRLFSKPAALIPPPGIRQFSVTTPDSDLLDVWTNYGEDTSLTAPYVGLVFHGNGETVATGNFIPFFAHHGIPTFTFDYRGYGNSSGWPSEEKLLQDGETVWKAIQQRTGMKNSQAIILGNSIGTGPATWLASRIQPKALILLAGYASIDEILRDMPLYRPFTWLLRYHLPTVETLPRVKADCLILAHGKEDQTISFRHLALLAAAVNPTLIAQRTVLAGEQASHNDIFYKVEDLLDRNLDACLKEERVG